MKKRLHKSKKNKMLTGVCGGIADFFDIDPTLIRLAAVILALIHGIGILAYIILALVMPKADSVEAQYSDEEVEKMKSANTDQNEPEDNKKEASDSKAEKSGHSDSDFDEFFKK